MARRPIGASTFPPRHPTSARRRRPRAPDGTLRSIAGRCWTRLPLSVPRSVGHGWRARAAAAPSRRPTPPGRPVVGCCPGPAVPGPRPAAPRAPLGPGGPAHRAAADAVLERSRVASRTAVGASSRAAIGPTPEFLAPVPADRQRVRQTALGRARWTDGRGPPLGPTAGPPHHPQRARGVLARRRAAGCRRATAPADTAATHARPVRRAAAGRSGRCPARGPASRFRRPARGRDGRAAGRLQRPASLRRLGSGRLDPGPAFVASIAAAAGRRAAADGAGRRGRGTAGRSRGPARRQRQRGKGRAEKMGDERSIVGPAGIEPATKGL